MKERRNVISQNRDSHNQKVSSPRPKLTVFLAHSHLALRQPGAQRNGAETHVINNIDYRHDNHATLMVLNVAHPQCVSGTADNATEN
jgi:hypothetical protein